ARYLLLVHLQAGRVYRVARRVQVNESTCIEDGPVIQVCEVLAEQRRKLSDPLHTEIALPESSTATCGLATTGTEVPVSISDAVPQPIPASYRFDQMLLRTPSYCCHTTMALPRQSTAA
ncbi:MAG: hypothetical protein JSV90_05385, partial [Methanobacteriota archaeon]